MNKRLPTFYVFHGPDEFSCQAQLQAMRDQMGDPATAELNISVLDGKKAIAADVFSAACALPFLSTKRLVLVEGMLTWLARKGAGKSGKTELGKLAEGLATLPDWARVVFIEKSTLSDKNPILKLAKTEPGGYHKLFNPPRNPVRWITNQAQDDYDAEIEPRAAKALADVIGDDLRAADNELAKLAAYANGASITEDDVALLTPYVSEVSVFDMVDALGKRDGATASRLLHRLLEQDDPLRLFGMIVRQFRLLILAREYLNGGGAAKNLGKGIGVHPYVGEKLLGQVKAFPLDQLEKIYHFLLETDIGIKTGKIEGVLALDLLIASVTT